MTDSTRADRWVWAVRLCKTRSEATAACRGGHVKVNGQSVKPAATVTAGDRVEVRTHGVERIVEVVEVIEKRVGASVATSCYVDHTPPPPEDDRTSLARRERGSGRPTKRERRRLDRWRGA